MFRRKIMQYIFKVGWDTFQYLQERKDYEIWLQPRFQKFQNQ